MIHLRKLLPIYSVLFIGFMGYAITVPTYTSLMLHDGYFTNHLGFSSSEKKIILGLLIAMYPLGQFIGAPILGAISDVKGRKPLLLFSLFIGACLYFLTGFAIYKESLIWIFIFTLLTGMSEGNIAIAQSSIIDIVEKEKQSSYFGYIYIFISTSFVAGPLLAAITGLVPVFFVVGILLLLLALWILLSYKETNLTQTTTLKIKSTLFNFFSIFKKNPIRPFFFINFLIYLPIFGFFRIYPIYIIERFNVDFTTLSLYIAYVSLPMILINLTLIKPLSKFSHYNIVIVFGTLLGLSLLILPLITTLTYLWIPLFITTGLIAITLTFSVTFIAHLAPKKNQGSVMGNNQSLQVLAEALSGFLGATLASVSYFFPFIVFGIICLISIFSLYKKKKEQAG